LIIEILVAVLPWSRSGIHPAQQAPGTAQGDEQALKATISRLITATEIAERAIAGFKLTVRECDQNLGERLRTAERFCATWTASSRPASRCSTAWADRDGDTSGIPAAAAPAADPRAMVAAAQAFANGPARGSAAAPHDALFGIPADSGRLLAITCLFGLKCSPNSDGGYTLTGLDFGGASKVVAADADAASRRRR